MTILPHNAQPMKTLKHLKHDHLTVQGPATEKVEP